MPVGVSPEAAFTWQWRSSVVAIETVGPTKLQLFISDPAWKKFTDP